MRLLRQAAYDCPLPSTRQVVRPLSARPATAALAPEGLPKLASFAPKALDIRGADLGHSITQTAIDDGVDSRPIFNRFRLTSFASVA
jgi:hypothetical protein